jgi:hypothetical protein
VVATAWLWGGLHGAGNLPRGDGLSAGTPKSGVFDGSGRWSLLIDADRRTEGIDGCLVTVKNTKSETSTDYPLGEHGPEQETSLWQIHQGGHFRWTVNDESCVVIPKPGSHDAQSSPFEPEFEHGDSEAFVAKGQVEVKVTDFLDTPTCTIYLYDVATGKAVDRNEATTENPVVILDPSPARKAYVSDTGCGIQVTPSASSQTRAPSMLSD